MHALCAAYKRIAQTLTWLAEALLTSDGGLIRWTGDFAPTEPVIDLTTTDQPGPWLALVRTSDPHVASAAEKQAVTDAVSEYFHTRRQIDRHQRDEAQRRAHIVGEHASTNRLRRTA